MQKVKKDAVNQSYFSKKAIKTYLKAKCDDAGISMQDAYHLADVHRSSIQRWWRGKCEPSLSSLRKFEEAIERYKTCPRHKDDNVVSLKKIKTDQRFEKRFLADDPPAA